MTAGTPLGIPIPSGPLLPRIDVDRYPLVTLLAAGIAALLIAPTFVPARVVASVPRSDYRQPLARPLVTAAQPLDAPISAPPVLRNPYWPAYPTQVVQHLQLPPNASDYVLAPPLARVAPVPYPSGQLPDVVIASLIPVVADSIPFQPLASVPVVAYRPLPPVPQPFTLSQPLDAPIGSPIVLQPTRTDARASLLAQGIAAVLPVAADYVLPAGVVRTDRVVYPATVLDPQGLAWLPPSDEPPRVQLPVTVPRSSYPTVKLLATFSPIAPAADAPAAGAPLAFGRSVEARARARALPVPFVAAASGPDYVFPTPLPFVYRPPYPSQAPKKYPYLDLSVVTVFYDVRVRLGAEQLTIVGTTNQGLPVVGSERLVVLGSTNQGLPRVGFEPSATILGGYT